MSRPVLPERARMALQLLADGFTHTEVAGLMTISRPGVSSALATARKNLGVSTTGQAIARAVRRGLIT